MSSIVKIAMKKREGSGKEISKKYRAGGEVPAVFYGPEYRESVPVLVDKKAIAPYANSAHWETVRIDAGLPDGKTEMCLMREIQRNSITGEILHIDFYQLLKGHKVLVKVPVEIINKESCAGVKKGGVLEHVLHEIEMEVLPREIPDSLVVDVASLEIEDVVHVKDIAIPESAEIDEAMESVVLMITHARIEVEETGEEEEEEVMEVEVVAKGKGKEEEE